METGVWVDRASCRREGGISLEGGSLTERLGRAVLPSPFEGMLEGNGDKSAGSEIFLTYDLPFTQTSVCMQK